MSLRTISNAYKQEKATNRRMFPTTLQNIHFLVRQGLPFRGSQTEIGSNYTSEEKSVILSHCYGHALNLAVGCTVKKSTVCSEALESAYEITKLTKYFPREMFNSTKLLQNMKMRGVLDT